MHELLEINEPKPNRGNIKYDRDQDEITRISASELTYQEFFDRFLIPNKPCIITAISETWESANKWVLENQPNFQYLISKYGDCNVPVADCDDKYYNSQKKIDLTFEEYLKYWENFQENSSMPLHYLKDWHMRKMYPLDEFYNVPIFFASDWLNEYLEDTNEDDYMFVYMGPKGTWTPFHSDVFISYSWSTNISGLKHWLIFPPNEEHLLKDSFGNLPYDVRKCEFLAAKKTKYYEVFQASGEGIFIPSGWHHQVCNLDDTISINHNWINGCNIETVWKAMKSNMENVIKEIRDCCEMEGWSEHCQLMLKATFGMNYEEFFKFLKHIARKRMNFVKKKEKILIFKKWELGPFHIKFDLKCIINVLEQFCDDENVKDIKWSEGDRPENLLSKIKECIL